MEFCTPDILGSPEKFRKIFALPIEKSRDASCSEATKALGKERGTFVSYWSPKMLLITFAHIVATELHNITKTFMLRRTQEVLEKFLPPRNDLVIFCQPSKLQSQIYKAYIDSDDVWHLFLSPLILFTLFLKKIQNMLFLTNIW